MRLNADRIRTRSVNHKTRTRNSRRTRTRIPCSRSMRKPFRFAFVVVVDRVRQTISLSQSIHSNFNEIVSLSTGTFESSISTDGAGTHRRCNCWALFVRAFQWDSRELFECQSLGIDQSKWNAVACQIAARSPSTHCPFHLSFIHCSLFRNCWCRRCPVERRTYSMWSHTTPKNTSAGAGCVHCAIFHMRNVCRRPHLAWIPNSLCQNGRSASATNRISANACRTANHIKWFAIHENRVENSIAKTMPTMRCIKSWISIVLLTLWHTLWRTPLMFASKISWTVYNSKFSSIKVSSIGREIESDSIYLKILFLSIFAELPCRSLTSDINPSSLDATDFDCVLCYRTLWKPVVTPCGHTYCMVSIIKSPQCTSNWADPYLKTFSVCLPLT